MTELFAGVLAGLFAGLLVGLTAVPAVGSDVSGAEASC
jgi:hypothetical protein